MTTAVTVGAASSGRTTPPLTLLLVSRCDAWTRAVKAAVGSRAADVVTCDADEAVTRLAGVETHYTHLLVHGSDGDGLTRALADLTQEIVNPGTSMLMLGSSHEPTRHPLRVISSAEPIVLQAALMNSPPRRCPVASLDAGELRAVLEGGGVEVRYQPIVRMADRRAVGLEALARLVHPTLGLLPPDSFVPQIEAAGLAPRFTELVSARMFADLAGPGLADTGLYVALNFTLDALQSPAVLARLEQQRIACGIPAERVVIELTESQPVHDAATVRPAVTHLRALGYGVAIDDVGPAVPHLGPLLELPFTSLKLDKALVQQADTSPAVLEYLTATVRDARRHGLSVVAEGVESETIWARMAAIGVDSVQGFLASRPLPRSAVPVWLKAWTGAHG